MHRDSRVRRATLWLATIGYALVASGLPVPLGVDHGARSSVSEKRLAGKDRSRPFPCMNKPCGCATAEQCFASCCCNTPAELLAWAKANRVEPGVIAALAGRVATSAPEAEPCCSVERATCCASDTEPQVATAQPSCCLTRTVSAASATDANDDPSRSVSLRAMRACQGLVAEWLLLAVSLPPITAGTIHLAAGTTTTVSAIDVSTFGTLPAPDGPPPRGA